MSFTAAVVTFPGSNCDRDMAVAIEQISGGTVHRVWHGDAELPDNLDLIALPGGFSYGDYLRSGAMAARSPIMQAVIAAANRGVAVLGVCNGFQVLTEAGLLPGALMRNAGIRFVCREVALTVESSQSLFTAGYAAGQRITIPVAHHDGNYFADEKPDDVLGHARRIAGGASPEIVSGDREALLFDIAEWLWERGDRHLALDATALALDLASKRDGTDPVQLARRLDRLAERLQEIGQYSLSADVWKRAIDLSEPIESEEGHAVTWRLGRYVWCLRMINAPEAQIDEVLSRMAKRRPLPGAAAQAPPTAPAAPLPEREIRPRSLSGDLESKTDPAKSDAKRLEQPRPAGSHDFETTAHVPMPEPAATDAYHRVPVHFATHRAFADPIGNPYETFSNAPPQRKALNFGLAHVTVPRNRDLGSLPRQGWLASKLADPDPALHITIRTIDLLDRGGFFGGLRERIGNSQRKEAFVFIHGYNNTFTDALMRTAQLAVDLEIDGAPILYSWPSRGTMLGYVADREQSRNTELHRDLQAFLIEVAETTGATHVHLVAHSMGAQLLISTLDRIQEAAPKPLASRFDQIVFASPDVAFDQFTAAVQRVQPLGRRVTVYASRRDVPLTLAGYLAGGERTGLDASMLASLNGVSKKHYK